MATHNDLGKTGEELAVQYFITRGYEILHQNWRFSHYEIDLIAKKNNKLHFIEVKTRTSSLYGHPEESVTKKKFKYLQKAADEYLHQNKGFKWIQYDILAITLHKNNPAEFFILEDVFL